MICYFPLTKKGRVWKYSEAKQRQFKKKKTGKKRNKEGSETEDDLETLFPQHEIEKLKDGGIRTRIGLKTLKK